MLLNFFLKGQDAKTLEWRRWEKQRLNSFTHEIGQITSLLIRETTNHPLTNNPNLDWLNLDWLLNTTVSLLMICCWYIQPGKEIASSLGGEGMKYAEQLRYLIPRLGLGLSILAAFYVAKLAIEAKRERDDSSANISDKHLAKIGAIIAKYPEFKITPDLGVERDHPNHEVKRSLNQAQIKASQCFNELSQSLANAYFLKKTQLDNNDLERLTPDCRFFAKTGLALWSKTTQKQLIENPPRDITELKP